VRVVYFYSSLIFGNESYEQRALAHISIRSVRRYMPSAKILHLGDHKTKTLEGVDEFLAIEWKRGTNRADAHALIHGEALYLDTDTVVTRDLSPVFRENFQVAVAVREDPTETMRYNGGVIFCRDEHIWRDVSERIRSVGDAELGFNQALLSGKYKVHELPVAYNYTPPSDVAVYHFKGPRKRVMLDMA
jgi:hypothetical protein